MLDRTIKQIADKRIALVLAARRKEFQRQLDQYRAILSGRTISPRPEFLGPFNDLFVDEIVKRARGHWDTMKEVLDATGVEPKASLCTDIKMEIEFYTPRALWELADEYAVLTGDTRGCKVPVLIEARDRVLEQIGSDIELYVANLIRLKKPASVPDLEGTIRVATSSLEAIIRERDLDALQTEFDRALESVESNPPSAITAACAIVESVCKVYIADEGLTLPSEQTVKPLWREVQSHLGLAPGTVIDSDLKRIAGSLATLVDGIGSLRTHAGSAHGRGRDSIQISSAHARLAVHSAHSLVHFVLEIWPRHLTDSA
jgi:hypothetical protein